MLDEVLLPEVKRLYQEMRVCEQGLSAEEKQNRHLPLRQNAERIIEMAEEAKREGLLSLEERVSQLDNSVPDAMLKELLMQMLDGEYPEILERNALMKFYSAERDTYQALTDIISIYGVMLMYMGTHPIPMIRQMRCLLPEDVALEEDYYAIHFRETKKCVNMVELCKGDLRLKPAQHGYFVVKLCDEIIRSLDDIAMQRVLKEMDNDPLIKLLNGLSGAARKKIFFNVSTEREKMLAENIEKRYDAALVTEWDLERTKTGAGDLLKKIGELEKHGEIIFPQNAVNDFLRLALNFMDQQDQNEYARKRSYDFLLKVLKDYQGEDD